MKEEQKPECPEEKPKMREIVIQTDGSNVQITKMEVAGALELRAILEALLAKVQIQ